MADRRSPSTPITYGPRGLLAIPICLDASEEIIPQTVIVTGGSGYIGARPDLICIQNFSLWSLQDHTLSLPSS